jgi:hypothetical protein
MIDKTTYKTWIDANQRYLVAEFDRLKGRLAGPDGPEEAAVSAPGPDETMPVPPAIDQLADGFGLSRFEREILLLCAGVEMNHELARACGTAMGGSARAQVTFGVALSVLEEAHWSALTPIGPLRRWRLVEVDDSTGLVNGRLRIDERILHYLAGVNYLDPRLQPLLRLRAPLEILAAAHQRIVATILTALQEGATAPGLVVLTGDDPDGQGDVAADIARRLNRHLYAISAAHIPANPAEVDALALLWQREAVLLNAALLVECRDRDAPPLTAQLLDGAGGLVFVTGQELPRMRRHAVSAVINRPEAADQQALWKEAMGAAGDRLNGSLDGIAWQFRLSAQTIVRTTWELRRQMAEGDKPDLLLWRACRRASRCRLDDLAQRIEALADWDALILPGPQKATLRMMAAHVRHRLTVYHDWGFAAAGARGLGMTALFSGESGTGKTMASEVLANELGLDLYRIDLSAVVSKYIGETERNLRRLFDAAEESGAILLFDEADALFGKRSEVKDSHDRYANIEVSYLLQRMEAYRGVAILTTNMKAALDGAFQRRLRFIVQFPFPDAAQREAIWRNLFPPAAPVEGLDYSKLARLQMAGGNIRNIAVNAAFLAAEGKEPVRMSHLLQAAQSEAAKRDRPLADAETRGWL